MRKRWAYLHVRASSFPDGACARTDGTVTCWGDNEMDRREAEGIRAVGGGAGDLA